MDKRRAERIPFVLVAPAIVMPSQESREGGYWRQTGSVVMKFADGDPCEIDAFNAMILELCDQEVAVRPHSE